MMQGSAPCADSILILQIFTFSHVIRQAELPRLAVAAVIAGRAAGGGDTVDVHLLYTLVRLLFERPQPVPAHRLAARAAQYISRHVKTGPLADVAGKMTAARQCQGTALSVTLSGGTTPASQTDCVEGSPCLGFTNLFSSVICRASNMDRQAASGFSGAPAAGASACCCCWARAAIDLELGKFRLEKSLQRCEVLAEVNAPAR